MLQGFIIDNCLVALSLCKLNDPLALQGLRPLSLHNGGPLGHYLYMNSCVLTVFYQCGCIGLPLTLTEFQFCNVIL